MNLQSLHHSSNDFPSYGFVRVGEPQMENKKFFIYKKKNTSFDPNTQGIEVLFSLYKVLQKDLIYLEYQLDSLKRKNDFNETWDKRYVKRLAVGANIVLAFWIFIFHFLRSIRGQGKVRTKVFELVKDIIYGEQKNLRKTIAKGFFAGLKKSAIYIFFSFLLTRPVSWCRILGAILSMGFSIYFASSYKFLVWQNSTNCLFNLLYIISSYKRETPLPTLQEYNLSQLQ